MGIYAEKHRLYRDYCHELDGFRKAPLMADDAKIDEWCEEYIAGRDSTWLNIFAPDGKLAGFLIIGKAGNEKHPDAAYGISQAYIAPEYRGQGLMTEAVNGYLKEHKGIYGLLVIKGNTYAYEFWEKTFKTAGYRSYALDVKYVVDNGDDLILLGFIPN